MTLDLDQILDGIDRQESDGDGWWDTSTGAEFGARKLAEVRALLDAQRAESGRLAQAILTAYQHIAGDDPDYREAGLVLFAALGFDPDALDIDPAPQAGGVTDSADQSERDGAALYDTPPAPPEHRGQHPHCEPCILIRDGANRA